MCTIISTATRDFLKEMISGVSKADVFVLVVSAGIGEFDYDVFKNGRAKDHISLANMLGVKQFIIVVNKMDSDQVDYSE